jgi:hypothetical protein
MKWILALVLSILCLGGISVVGQTSAPTAPTARLVRAKARAHRARHHKAHHATRHHAHPAKT